MKVRSISVKPVVEAGDFDVMIGSLTARLTVR